MWIKPGIIASANTFVVNAPAVVEFAPLGAEMAAAADGTSLRTITPWVGAIDGGTTANQDAITIWGGAVRAGLPTSSSSNIYSVTTKPASTGWAGGLTITGTIKSLPSAASVVLPRLYIGRQGFNNSLYFNFSYTKDGTTPANSGIDGVSLNKRILGTGTTLISATILSSARLQVGDTFTITVTATSITFQGYRSGVARGGGITYTPAVSQWAVASTNLLEALVNPSVGFDTLNTNDDISYTIAPLPVLSIDRMQPVVQRSGTGSTKVTIGGTIVPGTTALEARITDTTGTPGSWTALPANFGTARWAAYVNLPDAAQKVEVRSTATPATVATTNNFGPGAIILAYGQSNIGHWRSTDSATGAADVTRGYLYEGLTGGFRPCSRDLGGGTTGAGGGGAVAEYVARSALPTVVITQGISGASAATLSKGQPYYTAMIAEVMALGGKLEAIFWEQGHTEAVTLASGSNKATYKATVTQLIADIRADTGQPTLPVVITLMPPNPELIPTAAGSQASVHAGYQTMRQAQLELASEISNAYLGDHEMDAVFTSEVPTYNGHYAPTWLESGRRKARAVAVIKGYATNDLRGALPQSCTVSGNQLQVTFDLNGGTSISLPTPGSAPSDWQVAVNDSTFGTLNAITAASISGNVVTLTLTTPLTTGQTVYVRNGYGYWFDRSNMFKTNYASGASVATFPIVNALSSVA